MQARHNVVRPLDGPSLIFNVKLYHIKCTQVACVKGRESTRKWIESSTSNAVPFYQCIRAVHPFGNRTCIRPCYYLHNKDDLMRANSDYCVVLFFPLSHLLSPPFRNIELLLILFNASNEFSNAIIVFYFVYATQICHIKCNSLYGGIIAIELKIGAIN